VPNAPESPYTIQFILGTPTFARIETFNSDRCLLMPTASSEPTVYAVVNPNGSTLLPALEQAYPAGSWTVNTWLDGQPYVGAFQVGRGQVPVAPVAVARGADFGGWVRMLGYTVTPANVQPGGVLRLRLLWQIEQPTPVPYKTFVHLLGAPKPDGSIVYAQHDSQPCDDSLATIGWPTSDWLAADTFLNLPADLPAGTYTLQTGWYNSETGARAPVSADAGPHRDDAAQLQQIVVSR
jgi:hypothetical protein